MGTLMLRVPAMTCRHCVRKVTAALRDVPGVTLVQADLTTATVMLQGDALPADVLTALDAAGFPGTTLATADGPAPSSAGRRPRRARRAGR